MSTGMVSNRATSFIFLSALLMLWGLSVSCGNESNNGSQQTPAVSLTPVKLTDNDVEDQHPAWSPEGRKITFQRMKLSDEPVPDEIYTMNADGSEQTQLTNNQVADMMPVWSPSVDKIAFERPQEFARDSVVKIYVMNPDGSEQFPLSYHPNDLEDDGPSWSPDGQKVAFAHHETLYTGDHEIYVVNTDGSALTNLTNNPAYELNPDWSPDGQQIAYECDGEVCVMNSDGAGQTILTDESLTSDSHPTWSPDGQKIAFYRTYRFDESFPYTNICMMNADGTGLRCLISSHPASQQVEGGRRIAWSPDGQKIAFVHSNIHILDGNQDIYLMNVHSSEVQRITEDPLQDIRPVWSPDGSKIAFQSNRDGNDSEIYLLNIKGTK